MMIDSARRNRRRKGFTLMEVLLVLVILVILGSLVGVAINRTRKSAFKNIARTQVEMLEDAVSQYQLNVRRCPTTEQGLQALITAPSDLPNPERWEGPYLDDDTIPLDPWDSEYRYEDVDADNFRIWSVGPDGANNTEDDIST